MTGSSGHRKPASRNGASALAVTCIAAAMVVACTPTRHVRPADATPLRDVPNVLRGTIGAESDIRGIDPVLVSGLGVVVGLNGTGGGEIPAQVQSTMERELALGGVGKGGASTDTALGGMSPQQFLRRSDVAVVIVQAAIAPGSPKGTPFDVFVRILPGSSVTSLEGGLLWTTDLRLGSAAVFGASKTRKIAEARGPVFINPFSAPSVGPNGEVQITRTVGRILGGGNVTEPFKLELALDSDSPSRARSIVNAINSRFPPGSGDDGPIARGRGPSNSGTAALVGANASASAQKPGQEPPKYQSIAVVVPRAYYDRPGEFIQLVRHLRIDQSYPQEYARAYVEALKNEPGLSEQISWLIQAVGKPAVPFLAPMYEFPEYTPRMAALGAGARLGDQRAAVPLMELAKTGPPTLKSQALTLLGEMPPNPGINLALRELLSSRDLDVRVAAYEGLRKRGDPFIQSIVVGTDPRQPKFTLDIVSEGEPLVYVTQQGEARIVIFGSTPDQSGSPHNKRRSKYDSLLLNRPMLVTAFGDRLMLAGDSPDTPIRIRYQDPRSGQTIQGQPPEGLIEFIMYLAQKGSTDDPSPGLGMSYSDVVGALYAMTKQDGVAAAFATEQDRLRAEIYEASRSTTLTDRPEVDASPGDKVMVFKELEPIPGPDEPASAANQGKLTHVVPLTTPKKKAP